MTLIFDAYEPGKTPMNLPSSYANKTRADLYLPSSYASHAVFHGPICLAGRHLYSSTRGSRGASAALLRRRCPGSSVADQNTANPMVTVKAFPFVCCGVQSQSATALPVGGAALKRLAERML